MSSFRCFQFLLKLAAVKALDFFPMARSGNYAGSAKGGATVRLTNWALEPTTSSWNLGKDFTKRSENWTCQVVVFFNVVL